MVTSHFVVVQHLDYDHDAVDHDDDNAASTARVIKSRVRVQVANGTNVPQLAAKYTQELHDAGLGHLAARERSVAKKKTVIYYNAGQLKAAQEVATDDSRESVGDPPARDTQARLGCIGR